LVAVSGADGISLREAILAANNDSVPIEITFSAALLGQTITLSGPLPSLTREGTNVVGPAEAGAARVTISGAGLATCCDLDMLAVAASNVTVARLRFTDVTQGNTAIHVRAGTAHPPELTDIRIEDNEFDNAPRLSVAYAVRIGTDHGAVGSRIARVTVARNRFTHFRGTGSTAMLHGHGSRTVIEGVDIHDNVLEGCDFCVELVHTGSGNAIVGTRIARNSFAASRTGIILLNTTHSDVPVSGRNSIARTLVIGNRFMDDPRGAINVTAGHSGTVDNSISSIWFVNNIVSNVGAGVVMYGGTEGARSNRLEGALIAHNTFYGTRNPPLIVKADVDHSAGNTVADVWVLNSIFWNTPDFEGILTPQAVIHSITREAGYAGVNGNIDSDPLFIAPADGDFRLQPTSPAIDRGSSLCLVAADAWCNGRTGEPDIGAWELGSTQDSCGPSPSDFPAPCTPMAPP
jgi:hypothetical protein